MQLLISDAIGYFGKQGTGYGGRSAMANQLGITSQATHRWAGPFVPQDHADLLFSKFPALREFKKPRSRPPIRTNVKPRHRRTTLRKSR